ncbi:MAG: hypothetical protein AB1498_11450, partial [bacterium]
YTLKITINKDNTETTLGPVSFSVDKCVTPLSGDVHGPSKITAVDRSGICCSGTQEPAIILNNYGNGKSIAWTFDLVESGSDTTFSKIKELIIKSINWTTPGETPIYPMATLPINIDVLNKGKSVDLKINETVPADLLISDVLNAGIKTNNEITWQFNLLENTAKDLKYYLSMPDNTLQWTLLTEINYLDYDSTSSSADRWKFYNNYILNTANSRTMIELIQEIIDELNGMNLSPSDREKADTIIEKLEKIRLRNADTKKEFEKNIEDTLKAVDKLTEMTGTDITPLRLKLDVLMRINEIRWSRI